MSKGKFSDVAVQLIPYARFKKDGHPIAYFYYFSMKHVIATHWKHLPKTLVMSTYNSWRNKKNISSDNDESLMMMIWCLTSIQQIPYWT